VDFTQTMDVVSRTFELVGIAVLVVGFLSGIVLGLRDLVHGKRGGVYRMIRKYFGQSILLIRTFLSFSLEIEIEGIVPWRRWRLMAPGPLPPDHRNDTG
jgi:hypothetical protein